MRILVVDDDRAVRESLRRSLSFNGYTVDLAEDGVEALEAINNERPDALVLDVMMPRLDGLEVCRQLRSTGDDLPILVLTARDSVSERVSGLDAGADDYLGKPFELMELEARVRALLRRTRAGDAEQMKFGSISFDSTERQMFVNGKPLLLTAREIAVLEALLAKAGRIVSKENIFSSIYELESDASTSAIEVYVSRVRKKLDAAGAGVGIRVLRGLGYRLELAEEALSA